MATLQTISQHYRTYAPSWLPDWVSVVLGLFIIRYVYTFARVRYLRKKLGASYFTNAKPGYGFVLAYNIIQAKARGDMLDLALSRYSDLSNNNVGTYSLTIVGRDSVSTKDSENIKAILATQFSDFTLGLRHSQFEDVLGDGIFTLDGEGWKHSRAMLRPQFAREQVAHVKMLEPHIQALARHVRKSKGSTFDLQELFFSLTLDSATEFLFGESVDTLKDASVGYDENNVSFDGKREFAVSFNEAQEFLATKAVMQSLHHLFHPKRYTEVTANVHKFADHYVNQALDATPEELEKKSVEGYIFLYELAKHTKNPKVLRDQLLNILIAGRDTTAGLLSFTFFELSRNPHVWEKLREEIYEKFGKGDDAKLEEITFESLKKCEYLKAVINEGLRLYPSVPLNSRYAIRDTTLPRGGGPDGQSPVLIQKGQIVQYQIYCTHRDKAIYGEDAEEYRPERWFEESTKKLGWNFLPFNGGPRICLGQQFALTEASYVITRLVQMFPNLSSTVKQDAPVLIRSQLTVSLHEGCNVQLT